MPPLDLDFDPTTFSGEVPLFPLPNAILLPGNLIPLHVFEPRYRVMVRDVLAGERYLALALLKPGFESDYEGAPEIESHVCLGRIVMEEPMPDGRWNILLAGLRRARVVAEDRSRPYRLATVELLASDALPGEVEQTQGKEIAAELARVSPRLVRDSARFQATLHLLRTALPGQLALGTLLDIASDALTLGLADRLRLLETAGVAARAELLLRLLREREEELERIRRGASWPPGFSQN